MMKIAVKTDCWKREGVWGDRSCPELAKHTHCRSCPVYSAAAVRLLDRPVPDQCIDAWTAETAARQDSDEVGAMPVMIFRLQKEWFAIPIGAVSEVTDI